MNNLVRANTLKLLNSNGLEVEVADVATRYKHSREQFPVLSSAYNECASAYIEGTLSEKWVVLKNVVPSCAC